MTWEAVFPELRDDPVGGEMDDYHSAAGSARATAIALPAVNDQLARLIAALGGLRGAVADELVTWMSTLAGRAGELGATAATLEASCIAHSTELDALWVQASVDLRRAHDRCGELRAAEQALAIARQRIASSAPETALAEARVLSWQSAVVDQRAAELDASRLDYLALVDAELELRTATASALDELLTGAPLSAAVPRLAGPVGVLRSASEVWMCASFEQLARAVADRLAPLSGLVTDAAVARLVERHARAGPAIQFAALVALAELYRQLVAGPEREGDLGGTYDSERLGSWVSAHADAHDPGGPPSSAELGAGAVIEALRLTARSDAIGPDEFAVVALDDRRYVVVLPGVTDLSSPDLGLNDDHRTVRDLDRHAIESSTSADVRDNRYAQMVATGLAEFGVPIGSELMIVGHSYGADTALDLAADPLFNGAAGFAVTHVVAAGYYSDPQLAHVPERTRVLVLQNANDTVVNAERLAYHPVQAGDEATDALTDLVRGDLLGSVANLIGVATELVRSGRSLAPGVPVPRTGGLAPATGVSAPAAGQIVSVFDGGRSGVGHRQDNYIDYLRANDAPELAEFNASVAAAGYHEAGELHVIDVSVPHGQPPWRR